jgi:intracellular proteinase inhibitor BsuPI
LPRRPSKKSLLLAGAVVVLAVIVLIGAGFVSGKRGGRSSRATVTDSRGQRWEIILVASPTRVSPGAPVTLKLSIAKTTDYPQTISFSTNRQIELVARDDRGKEVWRSAEPSMTFDLSVSVGRNPTTYERSWTTPNGSGRYTVDGLILAEELKGKGRVRTAVVVG